MTSASSKLLGAGTAAWLIAGAILIYFHLSNSLVKPHYQYMVLIPPLVAFLLWNRWDSGRIKLSTPSKWWLIVWIVPLVLLAAGSWLFSPWIGMAALVTVGPAAALSIGGLSLWRSTWGVWLLGSFMLPLPLRIDERLIVSLRDLATKITSRILDYFGLLHMISGNVIELPEKKLFVADACSGIHSLFVLLAAAATVAVWNNRGPIATFTLLCATFGLVMIENVLRLLAVCFGIRWGLDLSEGTGHQVLGFCLFGFSLLMILSFDQWIAFMSIPRRAKMRVQESGVLMESHLAPFAILGGLAMFLVPLQLYRMPSEIPNLVGGFSKDIVISDLGKDFLPATRDGYQLKDHEKIVRVADDPFGQFSQVWRYNRGTYEVVVSLNYSYRALHDACLCYRNTGWNVRDETVMGIDDQGETVFQSPRGTGWNETPALAADMEHSLEGKAVLFYSMLSESGRCGIVVDSRKLGTSSAQAAGRFRTMEVGVPEQWVQLQMVAMKPGGFADDDRAQLNTWFREVQAMLFQRCAEELSK